MIKTQRPFYSHGLNRKKNKTKNTPTDPKETNTMMKSRYLLGNHPAVLHDSEYFCGGIKTNQSVKTLKLWAGEMIESWHITHLNRRGWWGCRMLHWKEDECYWHLLSVALMSWLISVYRVTQSPLWCNVVGLATLWHEHFKIKSWSQPKTMNNDMLFDVLTFSFFGFLNDTKYEVN